MNRTRHLLLAAGTAILAITAGCSTTDHRAAASSSTSVAAAAIAPVTFTHTSAPLAPTSSDISSTTAGRASSPATPAVPGRSALADQPTTGDWTETSGPAVNLGEPANAHEITAPTYNLDRIDRRSAEQVAWAYLVSLMSFSYTDPGPGIGAARAATYARPDATAPTRTTGSASAATAWAKVVATQTVSRAAVIQMTSYIPAGNESGAQASVHLSWIATLAQRGGGTQRTSGQTTLLEVRQPDGTWLVTDNGLGNPN